MENVLGLGTWMPQILEVPDELNDSPEVDPLSSAKKGLFKEVGDSGVWTVSSTKSGFGAHRMRDNLFDTYWQSDGQLPHLINILFRKKTVISDVCIFINHEKDESYTPSVVSFRCGTSFSDIRNVETIQLHEPNGWVIIPLRSTDKTSLLKTFLLQIAIMSNHQNGRDSHIRQIKIHSPAEPTYNGLLPIPQFPINFTTIDFLQFSTLR